MTTTANSPAADSPTADSPAANRAAADSPTANGPTADSPTADRAAAGDAAPSADGGAGAGRGADSGAGPVVEGLQARVVAGLSGVEARTWDALVPPTHGTLRHAALRAWELVDLPGLRSRPLVVEEVGGGGPVAACPGYWYRLDLVGTRLPAAGGVLRAARRVWPGLGTARTYELGCPTPLTSPFLVPDPARRTAAVRAVAEAAVAEADRGGAAFTMVQNLTSIDGPAARALRPLGFAAVPILPTVVVDLPYATFDGYLGAMRSSYRRRAHQVLKRSSGLSAEHVRDFAPLAGELARQWRLVYRRARELRREVLTPAYFRAMADLPGSSVLLLRRDDGSIASFGLLFDDRPWLAFLQCGFDEAAAKSEGAYFRLLYEIVRTAIEGSFRRVELGMTTVAPKLDIGGVPVPQYALLRHRNPLMQRAIRRFATGPAAPDAVAPRHVFKEGPPPVDVLVADRHEAPAAA